MPTYEYRCPQGHDFEKFFSRISEAASVLPCPDCGQEAERRISGGAGLLFKGSGFYLTDYGRNAHRSSAPDAKAGSGSDGAGGKSESGGSKDKAAGGSGSSAPSGGSSPGSASPGGTSSGGSSGKSGGGSGGGSRGGEQ